MVTYKYLWGNHFAVYFNKKRFGSVSESGKGWRFTPKDTVVVGPYFATLEECSTWLKRG